jgi:oxidase EvaA
MPRLYVSIEKAFMESALCNSGVTSLSDFLLWFDKQKTLSSFEVCRRALSELDGWHFQNDTGNLAHRSGKFFSIEGIDVRTNFGRVRQWMQPIINQPEIGILGFLTKKIDGILHFLVQAKMEPGNVNGLQVSPTVQATHSNFTKVHGGKKVPYLDWFLGNKHAHHLVDQLQSEQGSRYLTKRNRNIIIAVPENEPIDILEGFQWLTLGQLLELLKLDNVVNMDSRTVLSCIRYAGSDEGLRKLTAIRAASKFEEDVYISSIVDERHSLYSFDSLISWLTQMKTSYNLTVNRIPLNRVENWYYDGTMIRHCAGKYFSVIGVSVQIDNREVPHWHQPLIESAKGGIIGFICQKKQDVLHFLVQARVEPGNLDCLEMAPSLQFTSSNYDGCIPETFPPFHDLFTDININGVRYDVLQSEEGGRFYQDQNRYIVIEIDSKYNLSPPANYIWMTIRQMREFIRFNNYFNIEARGLLSCLSLKSPPTS